MTYFTVANGQNSGTDFDDFFNVPVGLSSFEIDAGGGIDRVEADVNAFLGLDWSTNNIEEFVLSGQASNWNGELSGSTAFFGIFGGHPKTVDVSSVLSTTVILSSSGTDLTVVGGASTVFGFYANAISSDNESIVDFNSGSATLLRPGQDTVSLNFVNAEIYSMPDVASNTITGNDQNNGVIVQTGSATFNAGGGVDTVYLSVFELGATIDDYSITATGGDNLTIHATGSKGVVDVTASSLERIVYLDADEDVDRTFAMDTGVGENAGEAYRIYKAAFARTPDNDGLKYWLSQIDKGVALLDVAGGFINSAEFKSVYGDSPSNGDFVARLYENVLGREGETEGIDFWTSELDSGNRDMAQVLADFSESPENVASLSATISDGIWLL